MMHGTLRPAVAALPLLALLAALGAPVRAAAAPAADPLILEFADVAAYARDHSPRLQAAAQDVAAAAAGRRGALAWSNPALATDLEKADGYREWQVALHKRIERPLGRGSLRAGWDGRVRAAELTAEQASRDLVAELQAGYVRLRLLEAERARLAELAGLVDRAARAARSRHAEGHLSGLDNRLIQLAAYTVKASAQRLRLQQERLAASWRADMGIPAGRDLRLATPVAYRPADLEALGGGGDLPAPPGEEARAALARALDAQADAARPGLLPGLDVYGGYRRFDPGVDGFVAGVAVDLPLFDRGAGEAGRLRAERLRVESELAGARIRRRAEVAALAAALRDLQPLLADGAARFADPPPAEALLAAYREGALSLDELLGAVQIEASALASHHEDLATYYETVFRLEALTGTALAGFTTPRSEP